MYSIAENMVSEFLSRVEEYSRAMGEGRLMVGSEYLDQHVIRPLRQRLREIRVIVGERPLG